MFPLVSLTLLLPVIGALALWLLPKKHSQYSHAIAVITTGLTLLGSIGVWLKGIGSGFSQVEEVTWIPSLDAAYRVGVDGISLPLILLTTTLFLVSAIYSIKIKKQPSTYAALFLLLETACLGVFMALDMILFYAFFELSLVFMYFIIAGWGHENRRRASLTFFIYTLLGSLPLLLAIIALYLGSGTFDMRAIIADPPLTGVIGLFATIMMLIAFAVKIPVVPLHSWLPIAHVEAPTAGSVILAGVLLKLGTYGLIRFALQMTPDQLAQLATIVVAFGVIAAIYGALAAMAQTDLKRLVAFTSINHMGYVVIAIGGAAVLSGQAFYFALDGAVLQMVSHGIVTGMLFLLVGMIKDRFGTKDLDNLRSLLTSAPLTAGLFIFGAFASLGLPGLAHFPAELQIFLGSFEAYPVAVVIAVVGVLFMAALYLRAISISFLPKAEKGVKEAFAISRPEAFSVLPLAALTLLIGIAPGIILTLVHATTTSLGL
jgi:NADH-quinone oxidoreductase subunit M